MERDLLDSYTINSTFENTINHLDDLRDQLHTARGRMLTCTTVDILRDAAHQYLNDDDDDYQIDDCEGIISRLVNLLEVTLKIPRKPRKPRKFGDKISADVRQIMHDNMHMFIRYNLHRDWCAENDTRGYQMTAIGVSHLKKLGHNAESIRRFLTENADMITTHHTDMGINTESHNRIKGRLNRHTDDDTF